MSTFTLTLSLALVLILLALIGLGLSWLITGKSNYKLGSCGKDPTLQKNKDGSCGKENGTENSCTLCQHKPGKKKGDPFEE